MFRALRKQRFVQKLKINVQKAGFFMQSSLHMFPAWSFSELQSLKATCLNKRCFILCTGPSLTREDILALKGEVTFGMNSICKLIPELGWAPTYFAIQDLHVYDKLGSSVANAQACNICFTSAELYAKRHPAGRWLAYPHNTVYHLYEAEYQSRYFARFSENCARVVYDGFSVTYSVLQLAVYMGFSEIYLLGADNGYSKTGKHHIVETGHVSNFADNATVRFNAAYEVAREFADARGIRIVNLTRGGALEVFPRDTLAHVLHNA